MANEQTEPAAKETPAIETMQKTLQERTQELEQFKSAFNDPTIQAVMEKIANGEEVVFGAEPDKQPASMKDMLGVNQKPEDVDIDSLSNKELVSVMSESMETYIQQQKADAVKEQQSELAQMKQALNQTQQTILKMGAKSQVDQLMAENKDFENYKERMVELSQKYPVMEMKDLYNLAKGEHLSSVPGINQLETEKPESSSPFPAWEPVHMRTAKSEEAKKSVGQSTTALRNPVGGRKDFANLVSATAARRVNAMNYGG